ncbi:MAG: hypothetical protein AB9834_21610 [Lentimicrobium sp.]
MKKLLFLLFLVVPFTVFPQCEVLNRLSPDGTMMYYMEPQNFYWTKSKELKGCVFTDRENYFIGLQPVPFPEKPAGNKLKDDLELKLSNGQLYKLAYYDSRYLENDTILELLYLVDAKDLEDMTTYEAIEVSLNMKGTEGIRKYVFKLHKSAIKEQLACFINEKKASKEKKK